MSTAESWTPLKLLQWTQVFFRDKDIPSPRLEAELLLSHAMGCQRIDLYVRFEQQLAPDLLAKFREMVKLRVQRMPIAYIEKRAHFYDQVFDVDARVLIPRPETEIMIDKTLAWARARGDLQAPARVIDIGCGSGCIGLTLAKHWPGAQVLLTDISKDALDVAGANAARLELTSCVTFSHGDLFDALSSHVEKGGADCLVSNPPYIADDERDGLQPEVLQYEPHTALFSGADGLDHLLRLLVGAAHWLKPGGALFLEIGQGQDEAIAALIPGNGLEPITIHKDLNDIPRIVELKRL